MAQNKQVAVPLSVEEWTLLENGSARHDLNPGGTKYSMVYPYLLPLFERLRAELAKPYCRSDHDIG